MAAWVWSQLRAAAPHRYPPGPRREGGLYRGRGPRWCDPSPSGWSRAPGSASPEQCDAVAATARGHEESGRCLGVGGWRVPRTSEPPLHALQTRKADIQGISQSVSAPSLLSTNGMPPFVRERLLRVGALCATVSVAVRGRSGCNDHSICVSGGRLRGPCHRRSPRRSQRPRCRGSPAESCPCGPRRLRRGRGGGHGVDQCDSPGWWPAVVAFVVLVLMLRAICAGPWGRATSGARRREHRPLPRRDPNRHGTGGWS
jgi:hypothetical protein